MHTTAYALHLTPPIGVGSLLSLGMKLCIKTPYPERNSLDASFAIFQRDIRLRSFFANGYEGEDSSEPFNPSLYIKSKWDPPLACYEIENRISAFNKLLASNPKLPL